MKLGVFLSRCGGSISKVIDYNALVNEFQHFACVRIFDDFYEPKSFRSLLEEVKINKLDALILAGVSALEYKNTRNGDFLFKCLREHGIKSDKLEVVNLLNMVSTPHRTGGLELVQKAQLLIQVGIEKLKCSHEIKTVEIAPRQSVAVIGANAGSIALSQHLLEAGYKVYMIHKDKEIRFPSDQLHRIGPTFMSVTCHPRFHVYNAANVEDFYGFTGDFTLRIQSEGEPVELLVGAAVLSLEEYREYRELVKMAHAKFHVGVDDGGEIEALDEQTSRSRTRDRGIFITNTLKHDPGDVSQMLLAADAVAPMVINLLNKKEIHHQVTVSQVDKNLCGGCGVCVKTCMFQAISLQEVPSVSVIDPRRCMGCGNCVTACPAEARDLVVCPTAYLYNAVNVLSKFTSKKNNPSLLLLTCEGHGYQSLDRAARSGLNWPVEVMPLSVVCGGQIDMQLIMHAFLTGFDGVVMMICGEGCCHNIIGNVDLERRVNLFKEILNSRGIDPERVHIISTCSRKGDDCVNELNQYYKRFATEKQSADTVMMTT